jgi:uncharacterized membrane-anchored protein
VKSIPDGKQFFQASKRQISPFSEKFHPSVQNWSALRLIYQMLNKVPELTLFFWIIKVCCTTVGETAADYLDIHWHLGLTGTTVVMGSLLSLVFIVQISSRKYTPSIYWLTVVLISIVGTLITDNLTDNLGVPLEITTLVFSGTLALTFILWYTSEKTLSVHTIVTRRREGSYWLAILFTFALGTAVGDLLAERLNLGYTVSALVFGTVIALVAVAHLRFKLNAILAFWIAYIVTRPLGASLGDLLSQSRGNGGLGFGTTHTSTLFLGTIFLLVIFLSMTRRGVVTQTSTVESLLVDPQLLRSHKTEQGVEVRGTGAERGKH